MITRLIDQARSYKGHEKDYSVNTTNIGVSPVDGRLALMTLLEGGVTMLGMTDWALGQLYGRLEPVIFSTDDYDDKAAWRGKRTWKHYLEACPRDLRAIHLEHWLNKAAQDWLVRAYDDQARAILSRQYAVVDILECLEWTKTAMDAQPHGTPFEFRNVYLTSDTLRLSVTMQNITIPQDGHSGEYGTGFDIGTGEIGNHKLWARPFVQRTHCMNSIVTKNEYAFEHRHVGSRQFLASEFMDAIVHAIKGTEDLLRRLAASIYEPMPDMNAIIADMVKRNGWPQETAVAIGAGTEQSETLWGLVQGISFASTQVEDQELRLDMDALAGAVLMGRRLNSVEEL